MIQNVAAVKDPNINNQHGAPERPSIRHSGSLATLRSVHQGRRRQKLVAPSVLAFALTREKCKRRYSFPRVGTRSA